MDIKAKKDFLINASFVAVWIAIIFITVKFLFAYLLPIVFAVLIAFLVQKPCEYISKKTNISRGILSVFLTLIIYAVIVGVFFLVSFIVFKFAGVIIDEIPKHIEEFVDFFKKNYENIRIKFKDMPPIITQFVDSSVKSLMNLSGEFVSVKTSAFLSSVAQRTPMLFVTWIVTVVISCYVAKDFKRLGIFFGEIIPQKILKKFARIKSIFTNSILKILLGYLIIMMITFIMLWIAFLILGIKNSFIVALIVSVIDLLPVLGVGLVLIPWALVSFFTNKVFLGAGLLATYFVILISRNFFEPKIISKQIGISPLLTLITMFVGLKVAGVGGMILSPLVLIIFIKYYKEEY